jgi:probable rRNA maturation factor
VIINVIDQQLTLKISVQEVRQIVQQVLLEEKQTCDEVNIYFVDTQTICQLHEDFFQDPTPTDCISFPLDEDHDENCPYRILGEVFVCPATAAEYAAQHHIDSYEETMLYIVHGLLHLLGYDDVLEEDQFLMRQAESRHIRELKNKNVQLRPSTHSESKDCV